MSKHIKYILVSAAGYCGFPGLLGLQGVGYICASHTLNFFSGNAGPQLASCKPDPSILFTWVDKRPTPVLTRVLFDPARWDFLTQGEKIEKIGIFRGNFPNPNQRWLTLPYPGFWQIASDGLGSKVFDPNPSLAICSIKILGLCGLRCTNTGMYHFT